VNADEPDTFTILAAANRLCTYCRSRLSGFLGTHPAHPHETNTDTLRRINDLANACCATWKGNEPDHWLGTGP
jgi:hypothetical protein